MRKLVVGVGVVLLFPAVVMAQQPPQSKEPLLLQLVDDISRARQQAEIERAVCQVQVKELQQQLQATEAKKTDGKKTEPAKDKK